MDNKQAQSEGDDARIELQGCFRVIIFVAVISIIIITVFKIPVLDRLGFTSKCPNDKKAKKWLEENGDQLANIIVNTAYDGGENKSLVEVKKVYINCDEETLNAIVRLRFSGYFRKEFYDVTGETTFNISKGLESPVEQVFVEWKPIDEPIDLQLGLQIERSFKRGLNNYLSGNENTINDKSKDHTTLDEDRSSTRIETRGADTENESHTHFGNDKYHLISKYLGNTEEIWLEFNMGKIESIEYQVTSRKNSQRIRLTGFVHKDGSIIVEFPSGKQYRISFESYPIVISSDLDGGNEQIYRPYE